MTDIAIRVVDHEDNIVMSMTMYEMQQKDIDAQVELLKGMFPWFEVSVSVR